MEVRPQAALRQPAADDGTAPTALNAPRQRRGVRKSQEETSTVASRSDRLFQEVLNAARPVIGIDIEPSGDLTRVRVIGDGPILTYKTERLHVAQFALVLPSLTTDLAGRALTVSTPHLQL